MVMIVFAAEAKGKSVSLPEVADGGWREAGKKLAKKHLAQRTMALNTKGRGMKTDEVLQLALGLELGTYLFDKYQPEPVEIYAALANAVRYARDIVNEPADKYDDNEVFCEIKRLEYLGLQHTPLRRDMWSMSWEKDQQGKPRFYYAEGRFACAVGAGMLKALALQKQSKRVKIFMTLAKKNIDVNDLLAEEPIYKIEDKGGDGDVEHCIFRLYDEILYGAEYEKRRQTAPVGGKYYQEFGGA